MNVTQIIQQTITTSNLGSPSFLHTSQLVYENIIDLFDYNNQSRIVAPINDLPICLLKSTGRLALIIKFMSVIALTQLPERIKGTHLDKAQRVQLSSNLFKVNFKSDTTVYIYSLRTTPVISFDNSKKLRALLMANRTPIEKQIGSFVMSGRTLYGSRLEKLHKGEETTLRMECEGTIYQLHLKMVRIVTMGDIYAAEKNKSGVAFNFLNNMLKNFFHQVGYSEIGKTKKYFDSVNKMYLDSAKVSIYKGYSSSFSLLENGLFLRMDPAVKIVRAETVLDTINNLYRTHSSLNKLEKRALVEGELINRTVMADYGKNRYYVIESVLFEICLETYKFNDGTRERNLLEYYRDTYNIDIQVKRQPLVKAYYDGKSRQETKIDIILVPELLLMSGLPDNFDERKRRDISDKTIVEPAEKMRDIEKIFKQFDKLAQDVFSPDLIEQKLNIQIERKPAKINAKQLNLPTLQLGGREKIDENKATSFMLFNKNLYSPDVSLKVAVFYPNEFDFQPIKKLFDSTCQNLGLQQKMIAYPMGFNDQRQALKNIESNINKECDNGSTNIFWFIIPSNFKSQYKALKRLTLKTGIDKNSQIAVTNTLQKKGVASILTKILLQMAAKVGNKLWVPKIPNRVASSGLMVVGIENYSDKSNKSLNVMSFCSNTNSEFSTFYSNYVYTAKQDGTNTHMKQILFDCLNQYISASQHPPSDVLILKNGSAKYDLALILQTEITEMKEILKVASKTYSPIRLIYTLVDTNSSQKFFSERGGNAVNPSSGVLINTEAVGRGFEFYLIAQHCNKGTVKPTFYKVVYSDSNMEEGLVEELLYTQCFNYMNWSGSIKIPSVLQYAKKLGMFVGQYLDQDNPSSEKMHRNLYFI